MDLTVVTITNRKRWHLLEQTLRAAFSGGASRAVVVDNEAAEPIAERMETSFSGRHRTIRLEPNQGSSGAYYFGIKKAVEDGAQYLLLLDDDNAVKPGAIETLKATYQRLLPQFSHDGLCVSGLRMDQEVLRGDMPEPIFPAGKRCLGFEVTQLLSRPWKRLPWGRRSRRPRTFQPPAKPVRRQLAPFGGMLFHRELIERFGYPEPRFVLYCDDVEFTHRIASGGGGHLA